MAYETQEGMYTVGDYVASGDMATVGQFGAVDPWYVQYKWYLIAGAAVVAAGVGYRIAKKRGWIGAASYDGLDADCGCGG